MLKTQHYPNMNSEVLHDLELMVVNNIQPNTSTLQIQTLTTLPYTSAVRCLGGVIGQQLLTVDNSVVITSPLDAANTINSWTPIGAPTVVTTANANYPGYFHNNPWYAVHAKVHKIERELTYTGKFNKMVGVATVTPNPTCFNVCGVTSDSVGAYAISLDTATSFYYPRNVPILSMTGTMASVTPYQTRTYSLDQPISLSTRSGVSANVTQLPYILINHQSPSSTSTTNVTSATRIFGNGVLGPGNCPGNGVIWFADNPSDVLITVNNIDTSAVFTLITRIKMTVSVTPDSPFAVVACKRPSSSMSNNF